MLFWGWEDMEEDGGSAASPTARAGWEGMSIHDPSLPEPSAEEAPPRGGNCGGRKVSMGDDGRCRESHGKGRVGLHVYSWFVFA